MKSISKISLVILLFLFPFFKNNYASTGRIGALGGTTFALIDDDLQLNLYDFAGNPAWLIQDQSRKWLDISVSNQHASGAFKRSYEPETQNESYLRFVGVKPLDDRQTFKGYFYYRNERRLRTPFAVERDIFRDDPFRLMDDTIGQIEFSGAELGFEYSRKMANRLFAGVLLDYRIESGLKKDFPKPAAINRDLTAKFGLIWDFSVRNKIGCEFFYENNQSSLEMAESGRNETRSLLLQVFRGERIFTQHLGASEFFTNSAGYGFQVEALTSIQPNWKFVILGRCRFDSLSVKNSLIRPDNEGYWQARQFSGQMRMAYDFNSTPLRLSCSYVYLNQNDWAQHPDFSVLIGDDDSMIHQLGLGICLTPMNSTLVWALECHWENSQVVKRDYISQLCADGRINYISAKSGLEYNPNQKCSFRIGGQIGQSRISSTLTQFSEFYHDHRTYALTGGIGWRNENLHLNFTIFYQIQKQSTLSILAAPSRNGFYVLAESRIFKF